MLYVKRVSMTLKLAKTGLHKGKYILVSKSNPKKVLRVFGKKKPSQKRIKLEERRIQYWKQHGKIKSIRPY
jgi:hypothetical protein